jgi:putative RecB family exonuclease
MFGAEGPDIAAWLASCRTVLDRYFDLEDPRRLEPAERELYVEALLDSKLLLRGFIDRLDIAPDGAIRIVDYKSGRSVPEWFEAKALFQMKFYALVIWRTRGVVPAMLQLIYLGNAEMLRYVPDEADLLATERKVEALWKAIVTAQENGDWRPHKSALCGWCAHQSICPAWGGTPPPLPTPEPVGVLTDGLAPEDTD